MCALTVALLFLHADLTAGESKPETVTINFQIAGDSWHIAGIGAADPMIDMPAGKDYVLEGLKGWTLEFVIDEEGKLEVGQVDKGPMMAQPPAAEVIQQHPAQTLRLTLPPEKRIALDFHPAYGSYAVAGYPMKWTGRRTVFMPPGQYPLMGDMGWAFNIVVGNEDVTIANPVPGPHGRDLGGLATEGFTASLGPPRAARIILAIAKSAGPYEITGLLEKGSGNRAVWLPQGEYSIKGHEWSVDLAVGEGRLEKVSLTGGNDNAADVKVEGGPGGTGILTWKAERPALPRINEPALYAFVQLGRQTFRRGETLRLSIVLKAPEALTGKLAIRAQSTDPDRPAAAEFLSEDWEAPPPSITRTFDIDTTALTPGEYDIVASFGELKSNAARILIARGENERATHFAICSYSHADPTFEERNLFNVDQPNHYGPRLLQPRIDEKAQGRYSAAWARPLGEPYELNQNVPGNQEFLEELTRHNIDAMLQYACAHQFFRSGTCPADPHIRRAVARGSALMVQAARQFEAFRGLVIGDEVAWPSGPDTCPRCEQDFEKQAGKPVPRTTDDPDLFRKWMIYKQTELANFFDYIGRRAGRIMPGVEINTQQGNTNFYTAGGGYPPINNGPLTLSTAHWYPDLHGSLTSVLGHEFVRMAPRRIPYWPLVWTTSSQWDWVTGEEARHAIYLAASRQTEGVGHFSGGAAPNTPRFAEIIGGEVHPNLTRNGDFLLQLRRDTQAEVAVFYSFEEQHRDCASTDLGPGARARRHVETVALALFSLVRNHFQAGLAGEEDILAGKLEGRPALLIVGITRMRPEVKKRIEAYAAAGGRVFIDAETTVEIEGAGKIDCRFDALWRREGVESTWPGDDKLYNEKTLDATRKALADAVPRPAVALSPLTITTRLKGGQGQYVWAVNDNVAMGNAAPEGKGFKALPHKDTIALPPAPAIYEVFSGRRMNGPVVDLDLPPGDARLFACLPAAPARVNVSAQLKEVAGRAALAWEAQIADADNKPIPAVIPIQVSVFDPNNKELATLYRSTLADGPASGAYVLPASTPPGTWSVRVTSLLGGTSAAASLEDAKPTPAAAFIAELGEVAAADATAIRKTVAGADAFYVVIGNMAYAQQAEEIATDLLEMGKKADVRLANELRHKELDRMFADGTFRKWTPDIGGPLTAVDRPCIAIGKPTDNPFIADVMLKSEILDQLVTPDYPGPGKGLVLHAWSAFSYVHNTIIVTGSDTTGIAKATERFAEIISE